MPIPKRNSRTLPASSPRPLLLSHSSTKILQTNLVSTVSAHRGAPVQSPSSRTSRPRKSSTNGVSKTYRSVFPRSFKRDPIVITRAEQHYLISEDGRKIYDASGGAAVSCLGPGPNKKIMKAMFKQLHRVAYVNSNEMTCPVIERYANALLATTWGHLVSCVFYSSGTASVDAALKLSIQYWAARGQPKRNIVIGRKQSYHGISLSALAVGSHLARRDLFRDNLMEVRHAMPCNPYNDQGQDESDKDYVARLKADMEAQIVDAGKDRIAAIIIEPIVGAALGCMPPVAGYLKAMRELCDDYDVILIFDEIMCGMGRTGTYFHAWQHDNVAPDILLTGKGMAAGHFPISGMLFNPKIYDVLKPTGGFNHGQTFENFPVACAAALAMLKIIEEGQLLENINKMGNLLKKRLIAEILPLDQVGDVRGRGFFLGLEFVKGKLLKNSFDAADEVSLSISRMGLDEFNIQFYPCGRSNGKDGDYLIIAPAFNIDEEHVEIIVSRLKELITTFFSNFKAKM